MLRLESSLLLLGVTQELLLRFSSKKLLQEAVGSVVLLWVKMGLWQLVVYFKSSETDE